ncbi:hypothetical protein LJB90_01420 [Eubacteriales bacterium OttesenSCG-928-G02]|nr:hypothetical protein [Eubacteriales bacterium OttesenSCG-928-G02]
MNNDIINFIRENSTRERTSCGCSGNDITTAGAGLQSQRSCCRNRNNAADEDYNRISGTVPDCGSNCENMRIIGLGDIMLPDCGNACMTRAFITSEALTLQSGEALPLSIITGNLQIKEGTDIILAPGEYSINYSFQSENTDTEFINLVPYINEAPLSWAQRKSVLGSGGIHSVITNSIVVTLFNESIFKFIVLSNNDVQMNNCNMCASINF